MIDKKKLKWTKEDDEVVRKFKRDLESGKVKTVKFTAESLNDIMKENPRLYKKLSKL